jgi:DNA-binding FadR family transcriptional regulator
LVDARPRRGTYVLDPREWNMLDLDIIGWRYDPRPNGQFLKSLEEVRQIIEPAAARLAAIRRTDHDLEALQGALDDMVGSADIGAAVAADLAFHRSLFAATHNEMSSTSRASWWPACAPATPWQCKRASTPTSPAMLRSSPRSPRGAKWRRKPPCTAS